MNFSQILSSPWNNIDLHAESVPHLLHWDYAYLWVLEQNPQGRPRNWKARVDVWRRLMSNFLLGQVQVRRQPLVGNLLRYANSVSAELLTVHVGDNPEPVGVLSPTVLIRPLPDLRISVDDLPEVTSRSGELGLFVQHLADLLRRQPATSTLPKRLAEILQQEFPQVGESTGSLYGNKFSRVRLLANSDATAWSAPEYVDLDVMVSTGQQVSSQHVPRCDCGAVLTQRPGQVFDVTGAEVELSCSQGHMKRVSLEEFFIWYDSEGATAHVWLDRAPQLPLAGVAVPPVPKIEGNTVKFEWPGVAVGPDVTRTSIVLRFPAGAKIQGLRWASLFYPKVVVPGAVERFSGFPVRAGSWNAVERKPEVRFLHGEIRYTGLKLRGIPRAIDFSYGSTQRQEAPKLQVGVFPSRMFDGWKRYRLFLGREASGYKLAASGMVRGFSDVAEVNTGWPEIVSVETNDGSAGTTWDSQNEVPKPHVPGGTPTLVVGLDFGTSHTVVCAQRESDQNPQWCSLKSVVASAALIAGSDDPEAPFLPRAGESTMIDSAIWFRPGDQPDFTPIRWSSRKPSEHYKPIHSFKWEDYPRQREPERRAYLRELMFLTLPALLRTLDVAGAAPTVRLGVAYPLAFNQQNAESFANVLDDLCSEMKAIFGVTQCKIYSISESHACALAFGSPDPGEFYLIADMGGATLDVALFKAISKQAGDERTAEYEQVGSVKFGGEQYLNAVARERSHGGVADEEEYWRVREAIATRAVPQMLGSGQEATDKVHRFLPMALEFLRTMIAAHAKQSGEKVRVIFAGNGWRLAELPLDQYSPDDARREYFTSKLKYFLNAELYTGQLGVSLSKQLVALGALRNALNSGQNYLAKKSEPTRIPAGRKVVFIPNGGSEVVVEWNQLVGQGASVAPALGTGNIRFDLASGPQAPPEWSRLIDSILPSQLRYPDDNKLRADLQREIDNDYLKRGPLQLILENHWADKI